MTLNISPIDRMILESLAKSSKSFEQLLVDTKIEKEILASLITELTIKNLINIHHETYFLNSNLNNSMLNEIKNEQAVIAEVSQLMKTTMKDSFLVEGCRFKLKKIYMDQEEERIFKSLLLQVEGFLEGLDKKRGKTCEQSVIFWGINKYENITNSLLSYN